MVSARRLFERTSNHGSAFVLALMVLAATACTASATVDLSGDASEGDAESTARTIPEEAPTTTTTGFAPTIELGPLPDAEWLEDEFTLQPVARTDGVLAMATRAGSDDLWIVERHGRVRLIQRRVSLDNKLEAMKLVDTVVLDITHKVSTEGEGGLLGLDFSTNGQLLYVSYNNNSGDSVIAEYEMDLITALERTERIVLEVEQPFSNHNGGQITFGPDGFLYVGLGDGGSGGDPLGSGQDTSTLLGSLLRIDPFEQSDDLSYRIPADNPFAGRRGDRNEIWAYGLRNPWRFSFDGDNGDLWIGDVGQNQWEEINHLTAGRDPAGGGANLGWNTFEGDAPFGADTQAPSRYEAPAFVYDHSDGRCSVTGGYVYRGEQIDALSGVYTYGDFCTGEVFGLKQIDDGRYVHGPITINEPLSQIVSFGQGPEEELYIFEADGNISRLQTRRWPRAVELYGPDEEIPGGLYQIDVTPGPDDPVINEPPTTEAPEESSTTVPPTTVAPTTEATTP